MYLEVAHVRYRHRAHGGYVIDVRCLGKAGALSKDRLSRTGDFVFGFRDGNEIAI